MLSRESLGTLFFEIRSPPGLCEREFGPPWLIKESGHPNIHAVGTAGFTSSSYQFLDGPYAQGTCALASRRTEYDDGASTRRRCSFSFTFSLAHVDPARRRAPTVPQQ